MRSSVYIERQQRARKDYACEECRKPIVRGAVYVYAFVVVDGDPDWLRMCAECEAYRDAVEPAVRRARAAGYGPDLDDNCTYEFGSMHAHFEETLVGYVRDNSNAL